VDNKFLAKLILFAMEIQRDEKEKTAIEFLVTKLKEEKFWDEKRHDDFTILRFLRARQFNLEKATKMILECEKWRVDIKIDSLVERYITF
jgi:SOS response regulatory protein OraA/RecX